ncbi:TRAP transporter large permease subunit [Paracoccus mutanolyticus]|uniref:TRAP transporter large permease subunit n=1 Tax=Paracoccus mutanolyticus TaxID=1499308 RepID=UPI0037C83CA5
MVTPTEAAVVAVVYALFVGLVVYRELEARAVRGVMRSGLAWPDQALGDRGDLRRRDPGGKHLSGIVAVGS